MKVCLFGLGYFGSVHARTLKAMGVLNCVVDVDPSRAQKAKEFGVPFICADCAKLVTVERDGKGNPVGHKISKALVPPELMMADAWDVATNIPSHFPLALLGLALGKRVLLEKPPTENVAELTYLAKNFSESFLAVNYIELAHPAVVAVKREFETKETKPDYFFHRRSKNFKQERVSGGRGSRIVLEELVHDISEILFLKSFKEGIPTVTRTTMKSWRDLGVEFQDIDPGKEVEAEFHLEFSDGTAAQVQGSFAAPAVRAFVAANLKEGIGYFVNTLSRAHIKPVVARLSGKAVITEATKAIQQGEALIQQEQDALLDRLGAERFQLGTQHPLEAMLKNFLTAAVPDDFICGVPLALKVSEIAQAVYAKALTI